MDRPDILAVIARREALEAELLALDRMRGVLLAETEELSVAERVLRKLGELSSVNQFPPIETGEVSPNQS